MKDKTLNVYSSLVGLVSTDVMYAIIREISSFTACVVVTIFSTNALAVEPPPIFLCKGADGRAEVTDTKRNSSCKLLDIPGGENREIAKLSDDEAISYFKSSVERNVIDAKSIIYRLITISRKREYACGSVNYKNSVGEYVGFSYYAVRLEEGGYSKAMRLTTPERVAIFCI